MIVAYDGKGTFTASLDRQKNLRCWQEGLSGEESIARFLPLLL